MPRARAYATMWAVASRPLDGEPSQTASSLPQSLRSCSSRSHRRPGPGTHRAWSGLTTFDLGQPRLRMSYYRIVLAEGQHDDLAQYLDRDLLVSLWQAHGLVERLSQDLDVATENPDRMEDIATHC